MLCFCALRVQIYFIVKTRTSRHDHDHGLNSKKLTSAMPPRLLLRVWYWFQIRREYPGRGSSWCNPQEWSQADSDPQRHTRFMVSTDSTGNSPSNTLNMKLLLIFLGISLIQVWENFALLRFSFLKVGSSIRLENTQITLSDLTITPFLTLKNWCVCTEATTLQPLSHAHHRGTLSTQMVTTPVMDSRGGGGWQASTSVHVIHGSLACAQTFT